MKMKNRKKPFAKIESIQLTYELIQKEIKYITKYAQKGVSKVITLGNVLLFFSTFDGDAWLLDIEDRLALQLVDQGEISPYQVKDAKDTFSIEWKAQYEIMNHNFAVIDKNGKVRMFFDYPVEEIHNRIKEAARFSKSQIGKS